MSYIQPIQHVVIRDARADKTRFSPLAFAPHERIHAMREAMLRQGRDHWFHIERGGTLWHTGTAGYRVTDAILTAVWQDGTALCVRADLDTRERGMSGAAWVTLAAIEAPQEIVDAIMPALWLTYRPERRDTAIAAVAEALRQHVRGMPASR